MTRRVRVLRVIARMNVGGPALQVTALQRHLDPARFESRLVTGDLDDGEADYVALRAPGLEVERLPGLGRSIRPGDDLRALIELRRLMREFRPDIVHTHTAKAGALGRIAARTTRVPYVVHTYHGHLLHGYFRPAVTAAMVRFERALARSTDRLVAVGAQVRDDLVAAGIGRRDQYDVVPPGVITPPAVERAVARASLGLPIEGIVVAFVARLTSIKRPERAIEAIAEVRRHHPGVMLVVAGGGTELERMQALAAPLGDAVRFLGWVPDVAAVYAAADIVLLTSDNEGMPVSLIEAAAAGRPVVTTRVGSVDEVVVDGRSGLVVDTPEELAPALGRLVADAGRRASMGREAAVVALERFGEQRLVQDVEGIYDRLLATPVRRGRRAMPG